MPNSKKEIIKRVLLAAKASSDRLELSQMDRLLTGLCANKTEHIALFKHLENYFTRNPHKPFFRLNASGKQAIDEMAAQFAAIGTLIRPKLEQLQQENHLLSWESSLTAASVHCRNHFILYISIDEIENYYYLKIQCPILADANKLPFTWNETIMAAAHLEKSSFLEDLIRIYATFK